MLQTISLIAGTSVSLMALFAFAVKWALNGTRKDISTIKASTIEIKYSMEKIGEKVNDHSERISRLEGSKY